MKHLLLLVLAGALSLSAQPTIPDCQITLFDLTATGVSAPFDNRGFNCTDWTVSVQFTGFSGAAVELDSAPNNAGVAGAFSLFNGGTTINGTNPITVFTQKAGNFAVTGFFPFLQLNITSLTGSGTIRVYAYGFRPIAFTTPKSTTQTANIVQIGGVPVFACGTQLPITLNASGNTQVIPHSGTLRTFICLGQVSWASGLDVQITSGTGGACGTGTFNVTGLMKNVATWTLPATAFSPMVIAAGQDTCINDSTNALGGGIIFFTQQP